MTLASGSPPAGCHCFRPCSIASMMRGRSSAGLMIESTEPTSTAR
jgi:hypothetical protein